MKVKINELVDKLRRYNYAYRQGTPIISDLEYDNEIELLRFLDPSNSFLHKVESEKFRGKIKVSHSPYMLSIEKAYDISVLKRFVNRIEKKANNIGLDDVMFRLTAKLDGLAGRDTGEILVSRGNGRFGYNISSAFLKGVVPIGGRGKRVGEIVVVKSYFFQNMTNFFEHPRSMVVGIVSSDNVNINAKKALDDGQVHFMPYALMESVMMNGKELIHQYKDLYDLLLKDIDYPVDGLVVEVIDNNLRNSMGSTDHHYRWQMALKTKGETAYTSVTKINWQIGRSGNITPVMEVKPVYLSGAKIKRVTAHHAGNIRYHKIGEGTIVKVIRSGEVIPKLESVVKAVGSVDIPICCPSCGNELNWNNNFLKCNNYGCRARVEQRISHWFKTLNNTEWFGIKTIRKIVDKGYSSLELIYKLSYIDFKSFGFTGTQSENLSNAIYRSIVTPVDDWRFLAAFGIPGLGLGDSFKLLSKVSIHDVPYVKKESIVSIYGFGDKTSQLIENGIKRARDIIINMLAMNFDLILTPIKNKRSVVNHQLVGKKIVFTGKMVFGSRNQLKAQARRIGSKVQDKVSKNTDYLICGTNEGKTKLNSAIKKGVSVLTEEEYISLLNKTIK